MEAKRRLIPAPADLDLRSALSPASSKGATARRFGDAWWRASLSPEGPATLRIVEGIGALACDAWGPGADWTLEQAPELLGLLDDPSSFQPPPGPIRDLDRAFPGQRFGATRRVYEALLPTILGQKVTAGAAVESWSRLVRRWGTPAPGPAPEGLYVPPTPATLAQVGYAAFHPLNVERRRAETILRAASSAGRLEAIVGMGAEQAEARLRALPGVGPWTSGIVRTIALGDPDAVPIGDFHLPNTVAWVLAGEERGDDDRMLELLEPYRGHRGRVLRLLLRAGAHAPARGARLGHQDITGL